MRFNEYKFLYLTVLIGVASLIFALTSPLREAVVDISVSPPKDVRKTDFSWITVNEWFNSQAHIIRSHHVLKNVEFDGDKDKLREMISAERLGAADIIRIHAKSKDGPKKLLKLVKWVAIFYLNYLRGEFKEAAISKKEIKLTKKSAEEIREKKIGTLQIDQAKLEKELGVLTQRLNRYNQELKEVEPQLKKQNNARNRISQINGQITAVQRKYNALKGVYTENWPAVSKIKRELEVLEKERDEELSVYELLAADNIEDKGNSVKNNINENRASIARLKNKLKSIDISLNRLVGSPKEEVSVKKKKSVSGKAKGSGFIINPPAINLLPDLWENLMRGVISGVLVWALMCLVFKKRSA